jgi:hypothetical protein
LPADANITFDGEVIKRITRRRQLQQQNEQNHHQHRQQQETRTTKKQATKKKKEESEEEEESEEKKILMMMNLNQLNHQLNPIKNFSFFIEMSMHHRLAMKLLEFEMLHRMQEIQLCLTIDRR